MNGGLCTIMTLVLYRMRSVEMLEMKAGSNLSPHSCPQCCLQLCKRAPICSIFQFIKFTKKGTILYMRFLEQSKSERQKVGCWFARGWEEGERGVTVPWAQGLSLGGWTDLEMDGGDVCTTVWTDLTALSPTLRNTLSSIFYHNTKAVQTRYTFWRTMLKSLSYGEKNKEKEPNWCWLKMNTIKI